MTDRLHKPKLGVRYIIVGGENRGRLCVIVERVNSNNSDILYRVNLCDGWGGPTDNAVIVKVGELEL